MTTAERPTVLTSLRRARELFLRGQQPPDGVPDDVLAAWKRARFFGVRHDADAPAPEAAAPVDSPLLAAARPVLDRIAGTLGPGETSLVLTDARLRVLWAAGFPPDHLVRDLSEERVGHNSAALALHTRRRAEVHGPEHFLDRWQDVSAVSVPVRAPGTDQPVGTVTVATGLCGGGAAGVACGVCVAYGKGGGCLEAAGREERAGAATGAGDAAGAGCEEGARAARGAGAGCGQGPWDAAGAGCGQGARDAAGTGREEGARDATGAGDAARAGCGQGTADAAGARPGQGAGDATGAGREQGAADATSAERKQETRSRQGARDATGTANRQGARAAARAGAAPGAGQGEGAGRGSHPGAPLAEAVAAAVETELLARSRTAERVLLDAYARAVGERGHAVVALDGRNRLVSEAAGRLLSPEALEVWERRAVTLIRESDSGHPAGLADGPDGSAPPAPLPDGPDGAAASLTPVSHQGSVIGVVVVLEPPGRPAPVTADRRDLGLAGGSVPWRHAVGRALELAASGEPLLLVGERGTGKTSLARELVADALLVDAAETELGAHADVLRTGRPLLVRHAERLTPPDTATLNSLLAAHPNVPLLATYTPGASPGPCLQRLLDTLAARSVTLPALRERSEDIRELLTSLTPSPRPGHPPLTWSLDALRALERHPWPGNVTELAHLVRTLAEHRRTTGPVRRGELPDAVREGPAPRPLTPMELAERSAILDALHLHGGNKARAAASLGIARATLYRKLRGYRD
ncbi:helix-turn-helix domain-containing protein [Streptomyces aquilus]|uniref:helix-turn-helix domain-containing protein n=1 Tax=Streptomyces aquilus TaxID=2548456 RepID=UPI0036769015